mmetsp:Transcript_39660/g.126733  ORF Transcript_39660/g.126733 Transcript_39660/m.126733 type:complete len:121 (+) Transcript_39660:495-857(+)
MNVINKSMAGIVKSLEKALSQSNLEQVSMTMEQFEKQFETLDVQSNVVEEAMSSSTSMSTPQDQVEQLMMEVADAHGLEVQLNMPTANTAVPAAPVAAPAQASQESGPQPQKWPSFRRAS